MQTNLGVTLAWSFGNSAETEGLKAELSEVQAENVALASGLEILQENMADVVMALDNQGWNPLGEDLDMTEIPLHSVKKTARTTRALVAVNPLIKRGVDVRKAYIWGEEVEFKGLDLTDAWVKSSNAQKYLLSPAACAEMESCLATDGNYFLLVSKGGTFYSGKKSVQRLPLAQIVGTVSNPDNHEEIWFYRREWLRTINSAESDVQSEQRYIEYVPAIDYDTTSFGRPRQMRGYPVNYGSVIAHHAVNKQTGWRWGIADILSVMFWAKAHKEFLENQATLVKAYSRFAFKATMPTRTGAQATATKVATSPGRDPYTGESNDVGATFVGAGGATLSSVGRTGGSVDFKAGLPLAGYVAAGLNVPLNELTADAGEANRASSETLSGSNEKIMQARQNENKAFLESVLGYLGYEVEVNFPPISMEAVYRQIQSIQQAAGLNVMSAEEIRALLLKAFDIETEAGVPTEKELGNLILAITQAKEQADAALKATADAAAKQPDTNNPSYGDNSHRSDAGQHAYAPNNG
jgi:hypothetical protein